MQLHKFIARRNNRNLNLTRQVHMLITQGEYTFNTKSFNEIPDLWHIANAHPDPMAREAILKVWYVANAYMRALNAIDESDTTIETINVTEDNWRYSWDQHDHD